jgi:type II secretory ATPase GspE/PulE/Tfp pilus assembly ATPase PilB-like protein
MKVTEAVREAIINKAGASIIRKLAVKEGMRTMLDDGMRKVAAQITTAKEVLRVCLE